MSEGHEMTEYAGFLPEIPPELAAIHQPFWASLQRHAAELQRCDACGAFRFIPSEICRCGSRQSTYTPIAGDGEVYTFTVVHRAPTPYYQERTPYVIAHVTLAEGPRMISNVVGCDPDAVHIGMPVRLTYDDVTPELTLYRFEPA